MPENIIKIGAEFDVSQIVSGSQEAVAAVDALGDSVAEQAAKFQQQGLSATEAADALKNLGYSAAEVASSLGVASVAEKEVAASSTSMVSAMGAARVEMGALEGSTGMMAGGLARVAAQSEILGPILQAAFPIFAIGAFVDILSVGAEKIYHVYENVILLKDAIAALDKASEAEAQHAAELNEQYEQSVARRLEAMGKFKESQAEDAKAAADKPLALPKIDDKEFKQFNAEFVSFLQSVHTQSDAPTVIARIGAEAASTAKQLDVAKEKLAEMTAGGAEGIAAAGPTYSRTSKDVEDLTKKYQMLQTMVGEVESQVGIASEASATKQVESSKRAAEEVKKQNEEENRLNERKEHGIELLDRFYEETQRAASAQSELKSSENEFFASKEDSSIDKQIEQIIKKTEAQQKYNEEVNKLAEQSSLRGVTSQESSVKDTASIERSKVPTETSSELGRVQLTQEINQQEIAQLESLENRKLEIQNKYLEDSKAILLGGETELNFVLFSGPKQLADLQSLNDQMHATQQEHVERMKQFNLQLSQDAQKTSDAEYATYMKFFGQVNSGFTTLTDRILQGNFTVEQSFVRMGASLITSTINSLEQVVLKWAEHFLIVDVLEKSAIAQRLITTVTGNASKLAVDKTAAEAEVVIQGGLAFAAGYTSAMIALPFPVNVSAAPAIGAEAEATVLAAGSAEHGAVVPEDMPIFAHAKEMVLPEHISTAIQGAVPAMGQFKQAMDAASSPSSSSSGNSSSSTMNSTHNFNIHALDPASFKEFAARNSRMLSGMARGMLRNGARP